jgi:hypothetical protein
VITSAVQLTPDDVGHGEMFVHADPYWHIIVQSLLRTAIIWWDVLPMAWKGGGKGCSHVCTENDPQAAEDDAANIYSPTP